ncbi:MAG: DUF721 domain-containing protein [Bacteroidales bacterium]|jgi:hypothetical protein|nr:DUF721 domain-containing protein [Bacteroidales bacterium]MBQ1636738.1 DUF721 domain-containing protein [Bacteroidales bacterium]MBQ1753373.1 DUF721 domain-containing protein [Bacteroidales bacterium]MCR5746041.1 DUF721 domain-containing protein [Bacteroidales bacterium]
MKREATRSLGEVIADFVQESHLTEGLRNTRIYAAWDALSMGRFRLGEYTTRHTFRDGVLTCRISSSVVRAHLQMQAENLRIRLNAALQEEVVKQVKLT